MSEAPAALFSSEFRYGSGCGSAASRSNALRNGASASRVTIQGEIVLAKFLDRKGPRGWYSQACRSRADQSFSMHRPNTCDSASLMLMRSPWLRSEEHTSELQSLMRISYAVFCLKK